MNQSKLLLLIYVALSTTLIQCKPEADTDSAPRAVVPPPVVEPTPAPTAKPLAPTKLEGEDVSAAVKVPIDGLPSFGNAKALVTIVAFTDYECPYCAKGDARIEQLRAEYGDKIRVVVGSHPLPFHDQAKPAARAFLAAVEQGKGEPMHARLFASAREGKPTLDEASLVKIAAEIGLDIDAFNRARNGVSTEQALAEASALGTKLGVEGTPTFFVNGRRIVGARPTEVFRALVDEEIGKAQALVDKGTPLTRLYATLQADAPEFVAQKIEGNEVAFDVSVQDAPIRGEARAPVTLVYFSDFECPFCVKGEQTIRDIEAANKGKVRVAFRHRPLPMHEHARLAAKASVAAERQGRFWEYHDILLQHRDALTRADLEKYAATAKLDVARFARDLDDPAVEARVAADEREADRLGVKGTPTTFVNGQKITGAQPLNVFQSAVDKLQVKALVR